MSADPPTLPLTGLPQCGLRYKISENFNMDKAFIDIRIVFAKFVRWKLKKGTQGT